MTGLQPLSQRQAHRDRRALAEVAVDRKRAPMALDDVLDDGEPQSRTAAIAASRGIDAVEAPGEERQVMTRNAWPRVADVYSNEAVLRRGRKANVAVRRRAAIAHGVAQQIIDQLGDLCKIAGDRRQIVLQLEVKLATASLRLVANMLDRALHDRPEIDLVRRGDEAVRLEKLTQDLLAFVRTGELKRTAVEPAAIVRDIIEADLANAPKAWSLDVERMREVIVNLVENGKQAGEPVAVRIAEQGRRLIIEVRDHGPGVPAGDRDKIFEPFFTGKTQGTGLGLAITRRIVELHRGTITVDDAPDGGALFRIEIPDGPHSRS